MVSYMSLWEQYLDDYSFPKLKQNIQVDTLIIGGGISGLTTLYYLKNENNICLVESAKIGSGITKNTTGKLTILQGIIYSDLAKNVSLTKSKQYLKSQIKAINLIKEIIKKEKINCDLEKVASYLVAIKKSDEKKLVQEKSFLKKAHINIKDTTFNNNKALKISDSYVFNPLKFLNSLKQILQNKMIYEQTKIDNIIKKDGYYLCTSKDLIIKTKKVIIACHYPFFLFPLLFPLKNHIEKSYLLAWKVNKNEKYSAITTSNPGFSIRFYQDGQNIYKIGLARSHATAFKENDAYNFKMVQKIFNIPANDIVACWSNVDIITNDKLPFIGKIKDNMYILTGYNTWGMTNSILGAKIISDLIKGKDNEFSSLFMLKRYNIAKLKSFFVNSLENILAFTKSKFPYKNWYQSNLKFTKINGKKIAIYTDEKEIEHIVYNECPHLKCSLIFNEIEKTWDCPCHSSRFNIDGKCIKGPSLSDISYKK